MSVLGIFRALKLNKHFQSIILCCLPRRTDDGSSHLFPPPVSCIHAPPAAACRRVAACFVRGWGDGAYYAHPWLLSWVKLIIGLNISLDFQFYGSEGMGAGINNYSVDPTVKPIDTRYA